MGKAFVFAALFTFGNAAVATTYTVTTTNDTVGVAGQFSLRDAILAVNAGSCMGDNIVFNLPATNMNVGGINYYQIRINYLDPAYLSGTVPTPLPTISCPVNIDGYTQPATTNFTAPATAGAPAPTPGSPLIEINGESIAANFAPTKPLLTPLINQRFPAGLVFIGRDPVTGCKGGTAGCTLLTNADNSIVRGLMINQFPRQGIYVYGADDMTIIGNYFGLDVTGEKATYANGRAEVGTSVAGSDDIKLGPSTGTYIGTTQADYLKGKIKVANRNVFGSSGRSAISMADLNDTSSTYGQCSDTVVTLPPPVGPGTTCRHPEIGSQNNVIQDNYIGLNKEGNCAIGGFTYAPGGSPGVPGDPGNCTSAGLRPVIGSNPAAIYSQRGGAAVFVQAVPANFDITSNTTINNVIGGLRPGQGNVVVANTNFGINMLAPDNQILGNIVGLNATGSSDTTNIPPIGRAPIVFQTGAFGNTVIGNTLANSLTSNGSSLFSGGGILVTTNGLTTVGITDVLAPNVVSNNYIGTNAAGAQSIGNKGSGITVVYDLPLLILNNVIAYNGNFATGGSLGLPGIVIRPFNVAGVEPPMRVSILSNQIYCNGLDNPVDPIDAQCGRGLGIDLNPTILPGGQVASGDGVTPNNPLNAATGPNDLQNFPLLSQAKRLGFLPIVNVNGSLNSVPNTYFLLQFFANDYAASETIPIVQGMGAVPVIIAQGKIYLGSWIVQTDSNGNSNFNALVLGLPNMLPTCSIDGASLGKSCINATATRLDVSNNEVNFSVTSEFSPAVVLN